MVQNNVTKTRNTIEINGQRYDASTGTPLHAKQVHSGQSIDGFTHNHKPAAPLAPARMPSYTTAALRKSAHAAVKADVSRPAPKTVHARQPETAKTLMRSAVSKPSLKKPFKTQHSNAQSVIPAEHYAPALKIASHAVNVDRATRAKSVARSEQVQKFSGATAIKAVPKAVTPVLPTGLDQASHQAGTQRHAQPSLDLFERALASATSHQPSKTKRKHRASIARRVTGYAAISLAVVILGGFIAWQNVANLELKFASTKAGFAANLPGYRPSGFSLGHLSYSAGDVALNFTSNSDDRHYAVIEKASDWDSQTLRDSYVASASNQQYQTIQAGDQTIYEYGNGNATWVSGGVWYQLSGNNSLDNRQLVSIATSI
jgi:hypothetical protein